MSSSRVGTPGTMMSMMNVPEEPERQVDTGQEKSALFTSHRRSGSGKNKMSSRQASSSSLQMLPPADGEDDRPVSASSVNIGLGSRPTSRQSEAGSRVGGNDHNLNTRTTTPKKQVALTSVRRKTDGQNTESEQDSLIGNGSPRKRLNGYYGDVHAMTTKLNQPLTPGEGSHPRGEGYTVEASSTRDTENPQIVHTNKKQSVSSLLSVVRTKPPSHISQPQQHTTHTKDSIKGVKGDSVAEAKRADVADDSSDDDDDDKDSDTEEEKKAPTELLMEFLGCLMEKDYKNAEKLCKMILLYEPENPEALKFQPLIEEKLKQAETTQGEEEGTSEDDDSDDDDEDSDDSSEESSSEEESEEEDEEDKTKPDS